MIKEAWYVMQIEGLRGDECPEFLVSYLTAKERQDVIKAATNSRKTVGKRDNSLLADFDARKNGELIIKRTIKGWKNLRNKHLSYIYDTSPEFSEKWEYKGDKGDKKADFEIKFTEELKREFSEVYDSDIVVNFINPALDFIDQLNKEEKEKELKN